MSQAVTSRADFEFNYQDAQYDDGGTGVSIEALAEYLFRGNKAAAGPLVEMSVGGVDVPTTVNVLDVRVEERRNDGDCLDVTIRVDDLTVGTQLSEYDIARFNREPVGDYKYYRIRFESQ